MFRWNTSHSDQFARITNTLPTNHSFNHSEVYFIVYIAFAVNFCNHSNNACSVKSILLISDSLQLVL